MPDIFVATDKETDAPIPSEPKPLDLDKPLFVETTNTNDIKSQGSHLFSSFYKNPRGIFVKNQEKEEKILLFIRRAMITNFKWILVSIIFLLLPLFAFLFVNFGGQIITFPIKYIIFFLLFYYLIIFSYIYVNFITWYFNISFVTNIRVIDIDFSGLIYKNVAVTKLSLIQDASFIQAGAIRTFFDYGDVFVQTAGTHSNFEFEAAPQPANAVHIINELIGKKNGNH